MAESVYLPLRAEPTRWAKAMQYAGFFSMGSFAFSAFWTRVISQNTSKEAYRGLLEMLHGLIWTTGVAVACWVVVVTVVYLLKSAQLISLHPRQPLGTIELREDALLLDDQTIAVRDLQSIVVTSDQYAGAPRGRSVSSGAGKITVVSKGAKQETAFLMVIQSAAELEKLRDLSAYWRSQQVTAFIMD